MSKEITQIIDDATNFNVNQNEASDLGFVLRDEKNTQAVQSLSPAIKNYLENAPDAISKDIKNNGEQFKETLSLWEGIKHSFSTTDEVSKYNKAYFDLAMGRFMGDKYFAVGRSKEDVKNYIRDNAEKIEEIESKGNDNTIINALAAFAGQTADIPTEHPAATAAATAYVGAAAAGGAILGAGFGAIPTAMTAAPIAAGNLMLYGAIVDGVQNTAGTIFREGLKPENKGKVDIDDLAMVSLAMGFGAGAGEAVFRKSLSTIGKLEGKYASLSKLGDVLKGMTPKGIVEALKIPTSKLSLGVKAYKELMASAIEKAPSTMSAGNFVKDTAFAGATNVVSDSFGFAGEEYAKSGEFSVSATADRVFSKEGLTSAVVGSTVAAGFGTANFVREQKNISDFKKTKSIYEMVEGVKEDINTSVPDFAPILKHTDITFNSETIMSIEKTAQKLGVIKSTIEGLKNYKGDKRAALDAMEIHMDGEAYIAPDQIQNLDKNFVKSFERVTGRKLSPDETTVIGYKELVLLAQEHQNVIDKIITFDVDGPSIGKVGEWIAETEKQTKAIKHIETKMLEMIANESDPVKQQQMKARMQEQTNQIVTDYTKNISDSNMAAERPLVPDSLKNSVNPETIKELTHVKTKVAEELLAARERERQNAIRDESAVDVKQMYIDDNDPAMSLAKKFERDHIFTHDELNKLTEGTDINPITLLDKQLGETPILSVDPRTVPDNLKSYTREEGLNKHGVFNNKGLSFEQFSQIAKNMGYENPHKLFNELRNAKTRKELLTERRNNIKDQVSEIAHANNPDTVEFRQQAFDNAAKVNLKEIGMVLKNAPATAKKLIREAGRSFKGVKELKTQAKAIADTTRLRDAKAAKYRRDAETHGKKAHDALASGDFVEYYSRKEKQALNNILEGEAGRRAVKVEKDLKRLTKKVNNREFHENVRRAGGKYEEIIYSILNSLETNPNKKAVNPTKMVEYVKGLQDRGRLMPDFDPSHFGEVKTNVKDMDLRTVEGFVQILNNVISDAERVVTLRDASDLRKRAMNYDQVKKLVIAENTTITPKMIEDAKVRDAQTENAKTAVDFLRKGGNWWKKHMTVMGVYADKTGKTFNDYFWRPLQDGERVLTMRNDYYNRMLDDLVSKSGVKDFNKMNQQEVIVEDLKAISERKDGKVNKADIFQMLLNFGNDGNRASLRDKTGLTDEALTKIFETHLTKEHFKLAQDIGNKVYGALRNERIDILKKQNKYVAPDIEVGRVKMFGEDVDGWYYPKATESNLQMSDVTAQRLKDVTSLLEGNHIQDWNSSIFNHEQIVGTNIERTSGGTLSLNHNTTVMTIEKELRSLHLAEPIGKVMDLLADKQIQDIYRTKLGKTVFEDVYMRNFTDFVRGYSEKNIDRSGIVKFMSKAMGNYSISKLAFNPSSYAKQLASAPLMLNNLAADAQSGFKLHAGKYMFEAGTMMMDPEQAHIIASKLAEISPSFNSKYKDIVTFSNVKGESLSALIGETMSNGAFDQDYRGKVGRSYDIIRSFGMDALNMASLQLNATQYVAAFNMAMDGKIKNVRQGDTHGAIAFAEAQVNKSLETVTGLNQAGFQNDPLIRNTIGMFASQINVISNNVLLGAQEVKEGWTNRSSSDMAQGVFRIMSGTIGNAFLAGYLGYAAKSVTSAATGSKDPKEPEALDLAIDSTFGGFIGLREFGNMFTKSQLNDVTRSTSGLPIIQAGQDVQQGGAAIFKLLRREDLTTNESKVLGRSITQSFGIPYMLGEQTVSMAESVFGLPAKIIGGAKGLIMELERQKDSVEPDQKPVYDNAINALKNNTIRDNPDSLILPTKKGDVELSVKEYKTIKMVTELTKVYNQNQYGSDADYLTDNQWNDVKESYPALNLPDSIKDASPKQIFSASWKHYGEGVELLKRLGRPVDTTNLYIISMMGDKAEEFFNTSNSTDISSWVGKDYRVPQGMTKAQLLKWVEDGASAHVDEAIQNIKNIDQTSR